MLWLSIGQTNGKVTESIAIIGTSRDLKVTRWSNISVIIRNSLMVMKTAVTKVKQL